MNILNLFKRKKKVMETGKRYVIYKDCYGPCEVEVKEVSKSGKMALVLYKNVPVGPEWLEIQQQEILDSL